MEGVPRNGMPIASLVRGEVTSGTHSPMLDKGIGMGVPAGSATPGSDSLDRRPRHERRATVVPKPIYKREEKDRRGRSRGVSRRPGRYHAEHDWARIEGDEATLGGDLVRAGRARRTRPLRGAGRR